MKWRRRESSSPATACYDEQIEPYCEVLGIDVPRLEVVKDCTDANYSSLLNIVLLQRGEPITLAEAARRFEEAGVAP